MTNEQAQRAANRDIEETIAFLDHGRQLTDRERDSWRNGFKLCMQHMSKIDGVEDSEAEAEMERRAAHRENLRPVTWEEMDTLAGILGIEPSSETESEEQDRPSFIGRRIRGFKKFIKRNYDEPLLYALLGTVLGLVAIGILEYFDFLSFK